MRTLLVLSGAALCGACSACCKSGIRSVDLSLRPAGADYPSYVWLGDTLTVAAVAGTDPHEFCYHALYSAVDQPTRFAYQSTDTLVASIDDHGLLRARSLGSTFLSARSAGAQSSALPVIVAPSVGALRLTSAPPTLNVGDTVAVSVDALDTLGNRIQGGQINFNLARPLDSVVAFVSPPRSQPPYATVSTPLTLRLRALRPGDATLVVEAPHEVPWSQLRPTASIVVHVGTKAGF
jgi:hypothetical protein